jgi:uncharacterized repeat protein (TIGR04138 family)
MQQINFEEVVNGIIEKNPRYHRDAYLFLREALEFTQKSLNKTQKSKSRDVSGSEFLEGIREYSLNQFGPMALTVLNEWGIQTCEDFGEMVFLMVEHNLFSKTETDSREDFKKGYKFEEAFKEPFLPAHKKTPGPEQKTIQSEV